MNNKLLVVYSALSMLKVIYKTRFLQENHWFYLILDKVISGTHIQKFVWPLVHFHGHRCRIILSGVPLNLICQNQKHFRGKFCKCFKKFNNYAIPLNMHNIISDFNLENFNPLCFVLQLSKQHKYVWFFREKIVSMNGQLCILKNK